MLCQQTLCRLASRMSSSKVCRALNGFQTATCRAVLAALAIGAGMCVVDPRHAVVVFAKRAALLTTALKNVSAQHGQAAIGQFAARSQRCAQAMKCIAVPQRMSHDFRDARFSAIDVSWLAIADMSRSCIRCCHQGPLPSHSRITHTLCKCVPV